MMQKKFEKLPGLSDVSGKYTKRLSSELYAQTVIANSAKNSGGLYPGPNARTSLNQSSLSSEGHSKLLSDRKAIGDSSTAAYGFQDLLDPSSAGPSIQIKPNSNVSSPSWPSSLSAASSGHDCQYSQSSDDHPHGVRRVKKPIEMVKSSSSGSVSNLGGKPTGIILATPSSPQTREGLASRFGHLNTGIHQGSKSKLSNSRRNLPSTPYPSRQTYRGDMGLPTEQRAMNSRAEQCLRDTHSDHERTSGYSSPVPTTGKSDMARRPSVLVRPISSSLRPTQLATHRNSPPSNLNETENPSGWPHHNRLSQIGQRVSHGTVSPLWSPEQYNCGRQSYAERFAQYYRDPVPCADNNGMAMSRASQSSAIPRACPPQDGRVSYTGSGMISRNLLNPSADKRSSNMRPNQLYYPQISSRGVPYGAQPRHASVGSIANVHLAQTVSPYSSGVTTTTTAGCGGGGLPGPQYTQCALEQYLSDLLSGEYSHLPSDAVLMSTGTTGEFCNSTERDQGNGGDAVDRLGCVEPLRFLEKRIENALDSLGKASECRMLITPSLIPSPALSVPCLQVILDQTGLLLLKNPKRTYGPEQSSPDTETSIRGRQTPDSMQAVPLRLRMVQSQSMRCESPVSSDVNPSSMLKQFTERELRYLLKAVQDLLVIRTSGSDNYDKLPSDSGSEPANRVEHNPRHVSAPDAKDVEGCSITGIRSASNSSRGTSRSNSAVRGASGEERSNAHQGVCTPESDSSAAALMHKRLPLGFQHFKRYLDSKFGPDHPLRMNESASSTMDYIMDSSSNVKNERSSLPPPGYDTPVMVPPSLNKERALPNTATEHQTSSGRYEVADEVSARFAVPSLCPDDVHQTSPVRSETSRGAVFTEGSVEVGQNQAFTTTQTAHQEQQSATDSAAQFTPGSCLNVVHPNQPPLRAVTPPYWAPAQYYPSEVEYDPQPCNINEHEPQETIPEVTPLRVVYPLAHQQRSYCSTPETTEIPPYNLDSAYAYQSRWSPCYSHCYWWPRHQDHVFQPYYGQFQAAQPTVEATHCQYCSQDVEQHQSGYLPHWPPWGEPNSMGVADATTAAASSGHPTGSTFVLQHGQQSSNGMNPSLSTGYPTAESVQCASNINMLDSSYLERVPFVYYSPLAVSQRAPYPFAFSPPYEVGSWNSAAYWNPRLFYHPSNLSGYYCRMPRSGSAGAGFGCGVEVNALNSCSSPSGPVGLRVARERSVGPELSGLTQPLSRTAHRYPGRPNLATGSGMMSTRGTAEFTPPALTPYAQNTAAAVRPMSNSLSANDLAVYRVLNPVEMRTTRSSFELSPELPCEPHLGIVDCTEFYSKIAAFIELDNSLHLPMPSGWCERRSSFGRSYYICDATREASWHHPTFGPHIPLGWERVDSAQNGVYYQSLLIPHCQRHHPNLWIPAPLKDPAVERESFFSDLRNLQSSMRYKLGVTCLELEDYKNATSEADEKAFVELFTQLDVETMVEVTRALDQLFYSELHSLIVSMEQERMRIVSVMFTLQPPERIFPLSEST
ncbi:unnamed protein product [Calicophoron daubneyi]|uniref:WW domain-containing protein n=1 Tax=Calicophoron daubneyi TaxID=300641 RepID=A0AAV2T3U2_CALDB